MKPLIGLTPTPELLQMEHGTFRRHTLSDHYSRAIAAAGGIPVMLPTNYTNVTEMLDRLDGLVITGGGDIDPAVYGQDIYPKTDGIDKERDDFEQAIFLAAIERDIPVLGICRGLQVFNTALGGTLHQDIDDQLPDNVQHRQQSLGVHHEDKFQTVTLLPGEHPLGSALNSSTIDVNSFHHQGIENIAADLLPMAVAEDGLIEAVCHKDVTYGVAVQWHPELLAHNHEEHAAIFRQFVEAGSAYQAKQSSLVGMVTK